MYNSGNTGDLSPRKTSPSRSTDARGSFDIPCNRAGSVPDPSALALDF